MVAGEAARERRAPAFWTNFLSLSLLSFLSFLSFSFLFPSWRGVVKNRLLKAVVLATALPWLQ
jgi:hypothetical protein